MHVEVDMKYMQTNFCGCGSSGFGDSVPFHLPLAKFPFQTMDYSPWDQKIESPQNIHASKDMQAEMQAHAQSLVGVASHFWRFCQILVLVRNKNSNYYAY